jgi:hypothetical protein
MGVSPRANQKTFWRHSFCAKNRVGESALCGADFRGAKEPRKSKGAVGWHHFAWPAPLGGRLAASRAPFKTSQGKRACLVSPPPPCTDGRRPSTCRSQFFLFALTLNVCELTRSHKQPYSDQPRFRCTSWGSGAAGGLHPTQR